MLNLNCARSFCSGPEDMASIDKSLEQILQKLHSEEEVYFNSLHCYWSAGTNSTVTVPVFEVGAQETQKCQSTQGSNGEGRQSI